LYLKNRLEKLFDSQEEQEKVIDCFINNWTIILELSMYLDQSFNKAPFDPTPSENLKSFYRKYIFQKKIINKFIMDYLNEIVNNLQNDVELPDKFTSILKICSQIKIYEFENEKLNLHLNSIMNEMKLVKDYSTDDYLNNDSIVHRISHLSEDDVDHILNYQFYSNEIESDPDGDFIDKIHKEWFGKWEKLERHHGYIQV
jgi:hypothetical protein